MKTIQITLEDTLIKQIDKAVKKLGTTRSALALKHELESLHIKQMELKQIEGYKNKPIVII